MLLKPINQTITVELTLEEVAEYNRAIDRYYVRKEGRASNFEGMNECPSCGTLFDKEAHHCSFCGQWVEFKECDVVPL